MNEPERIDVERLGGFAGYGLPGSRLRSKGEVLLTALSAGDRAAVDALFAGPASGAATSAARAAFRSRLTRLGAAHTVSIEVEEQQVPALLRDCVIDVIA